MALNLSQEDIAAIVAAFKPPTVRVPELNPNDIYGDISVDDQIPMHMAAFNKLVRVPLPVMRNWMLTGGNLSHPPTIVGNAMIVYVSALEAGGKIFSIPSIAGRDFVLRRSGVGAMSISDYEILNAGGFKLLRAEDELILDEQFELQFYGSGPATGVVTPGGAGAASGITGIKVVSNNTTLGPSDMGKLIQIRAANGSVTLTLPALETIPENTIIYFETNITNNNQSVIQTSGGQFIYFANTALSRIGIGVSESLVLYRGEDGYYVIHSSGNFLTVGDFRWGWKKGLNEMVLDGSLVSRGVYPRLWSFVQTVSAAIVSDQQWLSQDNDGNQPYIGCFSHGDGSTTFRIPNFLNSAIRSVKSLTGNDPLRLHNAPGGFQKDRVGTHTALINTQKGWDYNGGPNNEFIGNGDAAHLDVKNIAATINTGHPETTVKNIGMLPLLKC